MSGKKKIPCRVCGKLFEPCTYCQSHSDVFRWRNFACSIECAYKYINDTIAYRESLKEKKENIENTFVASQATDVESIVRKVAPKRKNIKKESSINSEVKNEIKNNETE